MYVLSVGIAVNQIRRIEDMNPPTTNIKPSTWFVAGAIACLFIILASGFLVISRSSGQSQAPASLNTLEFLRQVNTSLTRIPPHTDPFESKGGFNPEIGSTAENIWPLGGIRPKPDFGVALLMSIQSSNAGDTLSGAGAQQVRVDCLTIDYSPFHEIVDMDGINLVPMTEGCHRIQGAQVVVSGSNNRQLGDITIENLSTVYEIIPLDPSGNGLPGGTAQTAVWTVPKYRVAQIGNIFISTQGQLDLGLTIRRPPAGEFTFFLAVDGQQQMLIGITSGCYGTGTDFEFLASKGTGTVTAGLIFERLPIDSVSGECPRAESRLVVAP